MGTKGKDGRKASAQIWYSFDIIPIAHLADLLPNQTRRR